MAIGLVTLCLCACCLCLCVRMRIYILLAILHCFARSMRERARWLMHDDGLHLITADIVEPLDVCLSLSPLSLSHPVRGRRMSHIRMCVCVCVCV